MNPITILLIVVVAFLAGMEGILDEFEFHQPLVACTLIGLVSGHLTEGIMLGGSLQLMALGWANIGAAVAPDAALASVASAILMVLGLNGGTADSQGAITAAIAVAVPLSVAGLFLTMICRTIATGIVHIMDSAAVTATLDAMPAWLSGGMAVGGGMVAAVGYAMVINMMATAETWPFFALGFVLAALSELTLIALGVIGISLALIYLGLKDMAKQGGGSAGSGDPLGDILNDYE